MSRPASGPRGRDGSEDVVIRVRDLQKEFGDGLVLDGVDLDVPGGEILVLLGPNGAGKSVLLSCIAGGTRPSRGSVELFDRPVRAVPGEFASFMMQEAMAIETLTGRENISFYDRLHPAFTDRWQTYVETLGIGDDLDKRVAAYSGGMKRKLELAITLAIDVPIYLLDEPTAGIDLSMVQVIQDALLALVDRGRTVVMTSHLPADAELADRIAIVRRGSLPTIGPPEDLMAAVPRVVRFDGSRNAASAQPFLRNGRVFQGGGEPRGFLAADASIDALASALDGDDPVEETRPTYVDLFNYHVHLKDDAS